MSWSALDEHRPVFGAAACAICRECGVMATMAGGTAPTTPPG
ncbi:hypothetical protein QEZ54_07350 [Catellatospora sp. KI3]|nr:hypothetical protein [Catellatospora sp. KI3]MDI1460776.1 hypothetical protein [Catellatospora sp. KI3]